MASTQTYNFPKIMRGDSYDGRGFAIVVNGLPKDLTGWTAKAMFRLTNVSPPSMTLEMFDPLQTPEEIEADRANGIFKVLEIPNPTDGVLKIKGFKVVPLLFNPKPDQNIYKYDIELTNGEIVKTYIKGTWEIETDTTDTTR